MKETKRHPWSVGIVALLWIGLVISAWLHPARDISDTERRKLAQMPEISASGILSGDFMTSFESYTLDQFPLRDTFRQLKSVFHYYVLQQGDNNGIYIADGYAAQLEYPLNAASIDHAAAHLNKIYETYLKDSGSEIYLSIVPDKGYYLAQENGYPAMDYEALFNKVREETIWAQFIDITARLDITDYYRTDTHWRQEELLDVAQEICNAMGTSAPDRESYQKTVVEQPFYGVYYGQAALPMEPEVMYVLESALLKECSVYNHETGKHTSVYDMEKLTSRDLYDIYLSGAVSLLTIENPAGEKGRELVVFRDSFGSSLIPLLLQGYERVTMVDTRYISSDLLSEYVDFHGQDVLLLYSTLVLNNSVTLK